MLPSPHIPVDTSASLWWLVFRESFQKRLFLIQVIRLALQNSQGSLQEGCSALHFVRGSGNNPRFQCYGEFSCYDKHIHAVWTVVTEGPSSAVVICCKHMQSDKNQHHLTKINFVICNHQNSWFSVRLFKSLSSHNSFPSYFYGTEILCDFYLCTIWKPQLCSI